jgi:hypothetical protein
MDKQTQSRAPLIITIVLLALLLLYVGSYLALMDHQPIAPFARAANFRIGGSAAHYFYLPLIWIDSKVRPAYWWSESEWQTFKQDGARGQ